METVFSKTLDRLAEVGWKQGDAGGPGGPNCLLGAASHVLSYADYRAFLDGVYARTGGLFASVWNDHPARSFEDVALLLKELHEEALDAAGERLV